MNTPLVGTRAKNLGEVAKVFFKLGTTAFGGPAAHVAMMEEEFVRRRGWLTTEQFVDMIGAANLVPGPNSTEVAIHIGMRRAGVAGMFVAGACFIVPAALMVSAVAYAYVRFGSLPGFHSVLTGIKPVVIAIVGQAIWLLVGKVVNTWTKRVVLAAAFALALIGMNQLLLLLGSGVALGGKELWRTRSWRSALPVVTLLATVAAIASVPLAWEALHPGGGAATPLAVFVYFIKLGSVLYGSGYVLVAFLQTDLVANYRWLSRSQLFDAIAVGQFTPGPLFTTATFVGYLLAGPMGALAGTVGIFLPSFAFVAIGGKMLPKLRGTPVASGFLDGVNAAALALMGVVLVQLTRDGVRDVPGTVIAIAALLALVRFRLNSAILVVAGGILGALIGFLR